VRHRYAKRLKQAGEGGSAALGAYEWGAIEALFAHGELDRPERPACLRRSTGVSIGAIKAPARRRNQPKDGLDRLGILERYRSHGSGFRGISEARTSEFRLRARPALFAFPGSMPLGFWNLALDRLYNMRPLRKTAEDFVGFA
jgi:hypothetical protein